MFILRGLVLFRKSEKPTLFFYSLILLIDKFDKNFAVIKNEK